MAAKKLTKRRRTRAVVDVNSPEHPFAVLLEQVVDQNRAIIEAVRSNEQKFTAMISEHRAETRWQFETLSAAIRQNSADILENSADIRKNSEDIRKSSEDIQRLIEVTDSLAVQMRALTARVERIEQVLAIKADGPSASDLDARIRRIEERLGLV